jgi:hypothetical protein
MVRRRVAFDGDLGGNPGGNFGGNPSRQAEPSA